MGKLACLFALPVSCALLCLSGCGVGAMGQSVTTKTSGADDSGGIPAILDAPLAVGATTHPKVNLVLRGSAAPSMTLVSVRPDIIEVKGSKLVGKAPGVSAILMMTGDGSVLDFIHVWTAKPNRLELHRLNAEGAGRGEVSDVVELMVGESLWLAPRVYSDSQRLMGEAPTMWAISPPIAVPLRDGVPDRRRIVAKAPGQAVIKVSALGLQSSIQLKVVE